MGTGDFEDEVAVLVFRTPDEQAPPVEELNLGFKNGPFLLDHLQGDVSPAAVDFLGRDLQSAITGQGHHTRLARSQV